MSFYGNKPQKVPGHPNAPFDQSHSLAGIQWPEGGGTPQPSKPKDPNRWRKRRNALAIATLVCLLLVVIDLVVAGLAALMHFMQPDRC